MFRNRRKPLTFDQLKLLKTVSFIITQFLSHFIKHFMKDQQFKALHHLATCHSSVPNSTLIPVNLSTAGASLKDSRVFRTF